MNDAETAMDESRPRDPLLKALTLKAWADRTIPNRYHPTPFRVFETSVLSLCETYGLRNVLEIGAGRTPLFQTTDLEALGAEYHINDIEPGELALAPGEIPERNRACFDIGDRALTCPAEFDLVYSRSVFEHVADTAAAWRNSYQLLDSGGIALHFYPTLYAVPFVLNRILPEGLTARLMQPLTGLSHTKFPAYYDHCKSTDEVVALIKSVGFREVTLVPFWGHPYFDRIPVIRAVERWLYRMAANRDARFYSSYCYALARRI